MNTEYLEITAAADGGKPKVSGVAYSGGKMRLFGWSHPVVVDLSGMTVPERVSQGADCDGQPRCLTRRPALLHPPPRQPDDDGNTRRLSGARDSSEQPLANARASDVSDEETARIRKAQDAYSLAESLVDKYESKLRSAQEATAKQTSVAKPQGTFYANAAQSLRGSQMEQRMLTATQEIVKHTKKTAELLKDGAGNGGTLTFQ